MQSMCWHPVVPLLCSLHKLDHCLVTAMVLVLDALWCDFANYLFYLLLPLSYETLLHLGPITTQSRWGLRLWCMHSAIHRHARNLSLHQKPSTLAVPLLYFASHVHSVEECFMPMHLWDVCVYATASPERLLYYAHPRMALPPPSPPKHTCCSLHIATYLHVYALCTKHTS